MPCARAISIASAWLGASSKASTMTAGLRTALIWNRMTLLPVGNVGVVTLATGLPILTE